MAKDDKDAEPPPNLLSETKGKDEEPSPPMTAQEFADELGKLTGRARDAGVRTLKVMAAAGATELLNVLDGVLEGFEGSTKKAKPKAKKKAPRA